MEFLGNEYHFIVLIIIFKIIYNISDFLISELKYPAEKCTQQFRELCENCTINGYLYCLHEGCRLYKCSINQSNELVVLTDGDNVTEANT